MHRPAVRQLLQPTPFCCCCRSCRTLHFFCRCCAIYLPLPPLHICCHCPSANFPASPRWRTASTGHRQHNTDRPAPVSTIPSFLCTTAIPAALLPFGLSPPHFAFRCRICMRSSAFRPPRAAVCTGTVHQLHYHYLLATANYRRRRPGVCTAFHRICTAHLHHRLAQAGYRRHSIPSGDAQYITPSPSVSTGTRRAHTGWRHCNLLLPAIPNIHIALLITFQSVSILGMTSSALSLPDHFAHRHPYRQALSQFHFPAICRRIYAIQHNNNTLLHSTICCRPPPSRRLSLPNITAILSRPPTIRRRYTTSFRSHSPPHRGTYAGRHRSIRHCRCWRCSPAPPFQQHAYRTARCYPTFDQTDIIRPSAAAGSSSS